MAVTEKVYEESEKFVAVKGGVVAKRRRRPRNARIEVDLCLRRVLSVRMFQPVEYRFVTTIVSTLVGIPADSATLPFVKNN